MATRSYMSGDKVKFEMDDAEIQDLDNLLRKLDHIVDGDAVILKLSEKQTLRRWINFLTGARLLMGGETGEVEILDNK